MVRKAQVVMHTSREELQKHYHKENNPRIKERLLTILLLMEGSTLKQIAKIVQRNYSTVQEWYQKWNKGGYEGLIPNFHHAGGEPLLPTTEWEKIITEITDKGLTLDEAREYVKQTRHIEYSHAGIWYALRYRFKVPYGKPYIQNAKRPHDAEEQLKKNN